MNKPRFQQTLRRPFVVSGRGYWSGRNVCLTLYPLESNSGIQFQRVDLPGQPKVSALASNSRETSLRTRIVGANGESEFCVDMIEHVVSALAGMSIDNCLVQCDGEEIPGFDGSSLAIAHNIQSVGIHVQQHRVHTMSVSQPLRVGNIDQWVEARPKRGFVPTFEYRCDFGDEFPIEASIVSIANKPNEYLTEVAAARTFIRYRDARELQQSGLATHVTYQNLLVLDDDGPIENSYRYDDECARHKLLDLIGDIALCGVNLDADIIAYRSGHAMNGKLALRLQQLAATQMRSNENIEQSATERVSPANARSRPTETISKVA